MPKSASAAASLEDQFEALRWLREQKPAYIPKVPGAPLPGMEPDPPPLPGSSPSAAALAGNASAPSAGRPAAPEGMLDGQELLAWRTADEWRRIQEARDEMARAREQLVEHQKVLLSVGDAVHHEYMHFKDKKRNNDCRGEELAMVEDRLDTLRADLGRQYAQQQRWQSSGYGDFVGGGGYPSSPSSRGRGGAYGGGLQLGGGNASARYGSPGSPASPGSTPMSAVAGLPSFAPGSTAGDASGGLPQVSEMEQLARLLEETERKQRNLRELELQDHIQNRHNAPGLRPSPFAPSGGQVTPLATHPPPYQVAPLASRARGNGRTLAEPLPPPAPPPAFGDLSHASPATSQAAAAALSDRSGLLQAPPPPPSPPPTSVATIGGAGSSTPVGGLRNPYPPPASPPGGGPDSPGSWAGGASQEDFKELQRAMRTLFSAYAKSKTGVSGPRGVKERQAMGLNDFIAMARAAQLRIPQKDLEDAFFAITRGSHSAGGGADGGALSFELYVELLVQTGKLRYPGLPEEDATAALFEEHLWPLSRQIRTLEDNGHGTIRA